MSSGFGQLYRKVSGKVLELVVKPTLLGEVPQHQQHTQSEHKKAVCYVLQNDSNTNALVVDSETRRLKMPPALERLVLDSFEEKASLFFLQHRDQKNYEHKHYFPPRLLALIDYVQKNPEWDIELVPVTILWGRSPDKEDSLFKLLFSDTWEAPNAFKQMMNVGLHGRDSYVEFHEGLSLRSLIQVAAQVSPNLSPASYIVNKLNNALDRKRESVLGPDLSDRRNVMYSLIKSADVQDAIRKESIRDKISLQAAEQRAVGYVNEIVSDYSIATLRLADIVLTRLWTQLYDGVEIHNFNKVRELAQDYEIVYTPCHRSHIDYLLLSFVIHKQGLRVPYIAAGDNLNLPVVGQILRGGGAFFIRRSFRGNALYTSVFKQYLYSIVSRNTPLEYFIEGGRSRTGRLLPPKTGMLAMTAHAYFRAKTAKNTNKPVVFIPTYIGYERLMEGSTYIGEMQGKPKEAESILGLLKTVRKIERIFGKVHVNFGEPVFLDDVLKQYQIEQVNIQHNDEPMPRDVSEAVNGVAHQILQNINSAVVINPVSLISLALLSAEKHLLDERLCAQLLDAYRQILLLNPYDSVQKVTDLTGQEIIEYALKLKLIKRSQHILGNIVEIEKDQAVLLTYFRNNILHAYVIPALIATLIERNGSIQKEDLIQIIQRLYPFLKAEMFLKWELDELNAHIERDIASLVQLQVITQDEQRLYSASPNSHLHAILALLAAPLKQSLSRYYMTVMLIQHRGSGMISSKQVEDLSHLLGQRLAAMSESNSPEFADKTLFQSFLKELTRLKYIQTNDQGLIEYSKEFVDVSSYANLILDATSLSMLQKITNLTDDELKTALAEVVEQNSKRRARAKK